MNSLFILFVFGIAVSFGTTAGDVDGPTVSTSSGILVGKHRTDLHIKEFLGIPYGVPPLGQLRFQPPLPLTEERNKVVKVQKLSPICIQPVHMKSALNPLLHFNESTMSEDCLYLNLYVPFSDEPLPVIVFLVGEGFSYADPSQVDGGYLAASSNVIVATVNYRVSVFGFINTLNEDAPGNAGLWDQRLALTWIQQNIAAFGGNPNKVTLSGRFTGAMSAAIHAFSSLSLNESLFQRVILHSGVPDGKWIFDSTPLNSVTELAELVECVFSNFSATVSCIKNVPADKLLKAALSVQNAWRPSLDFKLIRSTDIAKLVKGDNSPVDALIVTNKDEGSLCLTALKVMKEDIYQKIVSDRLNKEEFAQLVNTFVFDVYKEENKAVNELISYIYSNNNYSDIKEKFVKFCGDLYITAASGKLADALSEKKSNLYVAELRHRASFSIQPDFITSGHGDDVLYSLGLPLKLNNLPHEEDQLTKRILKLMKNFMYYGNPNPVSSTNETQWPVYARDTKLVMTLDSEPDAEKVLKTSHEDAVYFWGTLIPNLFKRNCPMEPASAALTDAEENTGIPPHVTFLGTWVSVPAAQYIMTSLFFCSGFLLISLIISQIIIYRQTSSMAFHRLK